MLPQFLRNMRLTVFRGRVGSHGKKVFPVGEVFGDAVLHRQPEGHANHVRKDPPEFGVRVIRSRRIEGE
jgi:hypothetical protein